MPSFKNEQQKKLYLIMRAFRYGNIFATVALALYAGRHFFGA